jgi:hypothetical protein
MRAGHHRRGERDPAVSRLLEAAFEFGRSNLYVAFDAAGTREYADSLARVFAAQGISIAAPADLSGW